MAKVKHIQFLRFKPDTSQEQIEALFQSIMDVTEVVPGIEDYVSGENCSPEGESQGYTHGYVMSFSDVAARDSFLAHPEHQKLKAALLPLLDGSATLDFEV